MRNVPAVRVHGPLYPMAQEMPRAITKAVGQNVMQVCFEHTRFQILGYPHPDQQPNRFNLTLSNFSVKVFNRP